MGYRNYIGYMPKKEYNIIKDMNESELVDHYKIEKDEDGYWYKGVYEYGHELYEFGKYCDFKFTSYSYSDFFSNIELMNKYQENEFYIVKKEFLKSIILNYKEKIKNNYNNMISPFYNKDNRKFSEFINSYKRCLQGKVSFDFSKITNDEQIALSDIIEHIRYNCSEWNDIDILNLDNDSNEITTSWKYEYAIFELVRIYKTFNWEENIMIHYGY